VVERVGEAGTDEMTVMVETRDTSVDTQALKTDLERRMKEVLGVRVTAEIHDSGALDTYAGTSKTSKVKRLADRRP
jgi:phenylacetate-coenzyme A ligase PaaK-like adenylate-forming protein